MHLISVWYNTAIFLRLNLFYLLSEPLFFAAYVFLFI